MSQFTHVEVRVQRRPNPCSSATEILSAPDILDYRAVTRGKNHMWSLEEQVTLVLLVEAYQNSWSEKRNIFNSYIGHEFSEGALRKMYWELKTKFKSPFGNWFILRKSLETKAISLRIPLESIDRAQASPPRAPSNGRFDQLATGLFTPTSSRRSCRQLTTGLPTPTSSRRSHCQPTTDLLTPTSSRSYRQTGFPRLGFRAFDKSNQGINSSTMFRAGRFIDGDVPVPPSPHSLIYRNDARKQIERVHEGVTPFISTTSSLLRALSYAHSRKYPGSIAMIDLHKAGRVEDYQDSNNPFLQHVYRLNLKPGDSYKGKGEFLIYGEINKEAIICVLTLTQFMSRLPSLPSNDDPFGLQYLQPSEPLRESSECLCESPECSCKSTKRLHEVRRLIGRNHLPTNFSTGRIVGELLKALELPMEYLDDGTSTIVKDWAFKRHRDWRSNEAFKKGVSDGFRKNRFIKPLDPNLLGCSRLKAGLEEATGFQEIEIVPGDTIHAKIEEMSWSPDTSSEYFRVQETLEFPSPSNEFMQQLRNAAEITGPTQSEHHIPSDIITGLEGLLQIVSGDSFTEASLSGFKAGLVDYSDSEEDMQEDYELVQHE